MSFLVMGSIFSSSAILMRRESLKKFGWVKELPALVDENGVVLVGHRAAQSRHRRCCECWLRKRLSSD
jgi:hypothetical protein